MPRKRPSAAEGQAGEVDVERITGPTSALTSFLRDQGITAEHRARQQRQRDQASGSGAATPIDLDADESETPAPAPVPAEPVASTSKAKSKKRKKAEDADTELVLNTSKAKKSSFADRTPGKFTMCALCSSKFTISPYTVATDEGLICLPCERERKVPGGLASGNDGGAAAAKKPPAKKKRKDAEGVVVGGEKARVFVPSLQATCIGMIAKNIDELEDGDSLGEHLGGVHIDRIAAIVSKNRALTTETVKLFLHVSRRDLKLFDCTKLDTPAYTCIANLAPNVEQLMLNFCGRIDDDDLARFQRRLKRLRRLELYGPFNVTSGAWVAFFDAMVEAERTMDGFLLRQSPRFGHEAIARLAESFPLLTELRLAELGKLTDDSLALLHSLTSLKYLDISRAGLDAKALSDEAVVALLSHVGPGLETLVLNRNERLSDLTILEGIRPHCRHNLTHLELAGLTEVSGVAVAGLFVDWNASNDDDSRANAKLTVLNLHRCWDVDDAGLTAIIEHSGSTLRELDLNCCDQITEKGLGLISTGCPELEVIDLSMVRSTDDFLLKDMLDRLPNLRKVSVFGCNRVTDHCPRKANVAVVGQESSFSVRTL